MIDVSRFRLIYADGAFQRVLNAVDVSFMHFSDDVTEGITMPEFLEIVAVNEDGNLVVIKDETKKFQFVPILQKG